MSAWWRSAVVYQIYIRSFADSDGDGIGDLRGVLAKLDYLQRLGVDVLWLTPFYPSPQDDNGYDVSDYQGVDPLFGSLEDLDELVAAAHDRGLRLVIDLVVNHTSDEHAWFADSRRSVDSPRRDWYFWRAPRDGLSAGSPGAEPNDWESFFTGPAWELDPVTGEYYLHMFSRKQPDLNWDNPEVREAVYSMMRWWLDRGIDGFRMDVINFISKPAGLPDGDMLGLTANGHRIHEFLHEMHTEVLAGRGLMTVGEMPGSTVADAALYTDPARQELDMVFTFEHVELDAAPGGRKWDLVPLQLTSLKRTFAHWQEGLAERGWNSLYWSNHDQPRIVSRWGDDGAHRVVSAKAFGTVLHLLRGTPYVYQGEELGMTNAYLERLEDYRDIESVNLAREQLAEGVAEEVLLETLARKSRDNARTPMAWDSSPHGGFTTGTPWLPANQAYAEVNAAAAEADPDSVFHHYRRLISLRHELPVVVEGDVEMLLPDDEQVFAYLRRLDDTQLLVMANLSGDPARLVVDPRLAGFRRGRVLLGHADLSGSHLLLEPWQAFAVLD